MRGRNCVIDKMSGELGYNNAGFFFYIFDKTRGQK